MKRLFDIFFSIFGAFVLMLPMITIFFVIKFTSSGPGLFWSDRFGKDKKLFKMPKFRTMKEDTPIVATHILQDPKSHYTPFGLFLRKTSLDELPQLWSILKGDMSFVGPRPALMNQHDLVSLREEKDLNKLKPGLTGWAQINGRDELSIKDKVIYDEEYMQKFSIMFDILIIIRTIIRTIRKTNISH
jgi:O-antigen biosynthesis protein WbqP